MNRSLSSTTAARPDRWEVALVLIIVLSGLVFRGMHLDRLAVEHFDEGVYASNLWFGAEQRFRYPARHLYAPPLVPWLLEWSQVFLGPTHLGTMIVGIVSGALTIALVWWSVRSWFGISGGLAAAMLASWSDYHVLFSRTALTEPVLCLLLLASVFFLWRAVADINSRWAIVAGLSTGLAWCAKYNGWLPLAIGTAGLCGWAIVPKVKTPERGSRFLMLAVVWGLALLVVFPVWWDLRADGGYRVVQENHARYLVGLAGWSESFQRQLANHRFVEGPLSWLGLGLAVFLAGFGSWLERRRSNDPASSNRPRWPWLFCAATVATMSGMWLGTSITLAAAGFAWLIAACPWWRKTTTDDDVPNDLAYWLIAAWWMGLFLTTPLYTAYPRLSLPWLMAAWIAAAAMFGSPAGRQFVMGQQTWQTTAKGTIALILLDAVSIAGILGKAAWGQQNPLAAWDVRTGLEQSAAEIQQFVQQTHRGRAVIYIYAEPALFYHLRAQGIEAGPVADLGFADRPNPVPVYVAVGPHAERSTGFAEDFEKHAQQLELVEAFDFIPSRLVLLNYYAPERLNHPNFDPEQTMKLYRLKSP